MTTKKVRAKFTVHSIETFAFGESVKMNAVCYDGTDENAVFTKFTPSGSFEMHVQNEALFGFFKPGDDYYLDLTPCEPK